MKKPIVKTITEQQWRTLRSETHNTVNIILTAVEILVDKIYQTTGVVAVETLIGAGLFSHAIEEYGKLLYLKSLSLSEGKVEIELGGEKRGGKFDNHDYKFSLSEKKLPETCTLVHKSGYSDDYGDHYDTVNTVVTDWKTRLKIFNTDFDDAGNVVKYPVVDIHTLKNAVIEFRKVISETIP